MKRALTMTAIGLGAAAGWLLVMPAAPVAQPFAFNHARHGAMACVVCHDGAERQARAGLPAISLCDKCHATEPIAAARAVWANPRRDAVPWRQVTRVADHAMFSHRRHVAIARLECSSCHGDVGRRATPPPRAAVRLDMNGCLSCHQREGASQDCAGCHR